MAHAQTHFHHAGAMAQFRLELAGVVADVARITSEDAYTICSVAVASDGALLRGWPRGSALLLDCFDEAFARAHGTVETRLRLAYHEARASFLEGAIHVPPVLSGTEVKWPHASLVVAVVEGCDAYVLSIGDVCAVQVRGLAPVAVTGPDVYREGDLSVVTRSIWAGEPPGSAPTEAHLDLAPGDTLVLAPFSERVPSFIDQVAYASSCHLDVRRLASVLAFEHADDVQPTFGVCTLRVDDFDLEAR